MSQNPYGAGGGYQQYPAPGQAGYPAAPPVPGQPSYGGYPAYPAPPGGTGYPSQQPGYPSQQPGYPSQQPGFPSQQPGYPSQQPGYPPQQPGYPPQQPGNAGQQPGYPVQGSGYPNPGQQPSYPVQPSGTSGQQPGYPNQGSGYPSGQPGYPNPGSGGYPSQQPASSGYPNPGSQPGYPSQGGGHPPQQQPGGGGYPNPAAGYPGQQSGGYPAPGGGGSGYPSQPAGGYAAAPAAVVGHTAQKLGSSTKSRKGDPYHSGSTAHQDATHGTIRSFPDFDPADDASKLRKAMKGFGTDERAIIDILCQRSNSERQQILTAYKSGYGRDLIKDLKSELGGDFEDVILAIMMPPYNFLAEQLHSAMSGAGTDEDTLFETLCTHTNAEINGIKAAYGNMYGKSLEESVRSESSHNFKLLLTAILQANRNESHEVDPDKAADQAMALYRAGEKKSGTDEETFTMILATQSAAQLHAIMAEYENISKKTLLDAVKSEMSGDYRQALLAVLKSSLNRPAYFAERLRDAMSGAGTRDSDLIRLIVSRSEYDLANIKEEYVRRYGRTLEKDISSETSGDYKKALVMLVEGN